MKSRSAEQHDDNDEKCEWAFLMIDVINDLDFPGNEHLIEVSSELADNILSAKNAARDAGLPTIYVNDNFSKWRSSLSECIFAWFLAGKSHQNGRQFASFWPANRV